VPEEDGVEKFLYGCRYENGEWLRLFPMPYRYLTPKPAFSKISMDRGSLLQNLATPGLKLQTKDDSIKNSAVLFQVIQLASTEKRPISSESASLCALDRSGAERPSDLGFFRPKTIERLQVVAAVPPDWTAAQLAILRQEHLFQKRPSRELEKIPFYFRYQFSCDDDTCTGHALMCTDWEMGESYRSWRQQYGENGRSFAKI